MQWTSLQGEAEPNPQWASLRSGEGGKWRRPKKCPKVEVEQFLKEEGYVDREENGDGLLYLRRHVRKYDVSGEFS